VHCLRGHDLGGVAGELRAHQVALTGEHGVGQQVGVDEDLVADGERGQQRLGRGEHLVRHIDRRRRRLAADRLGRQQLVVVLLLLCGGADVAPSGRVEAVAELLGPDGVDDRGQHLGRGGDGRDAHPAR
jgi:hypothetical protein